MPVAYAAAPVRVPERVLMISSSGGVLLESLAVAGLLPVAQVHWVAVPAADTASALRGEGVRWVSEQSVSRPLALLRAIVHAHSILRQERPDLVVSAGTAVAVPFFIAARLQGVRSLWIETQNLVSGHGLAARICCRLATAVAVQRDSMRHVRSGAVVVGELY